MINNWLDIVLLAVILIFFVLGLVRGLLRQLLDIAAVICGLILAAWFYRPFSAVLGRAVASETWAYLIAFVVIFVGVLVVGGLVSFLVSKLVRGPLRFIDRLLGGVVGVVTGVLVCGVFVIAQLVFPVNKQALLGSSVAPYCYWLTKAMIQVVPRELKEKFRETYQEIVGGPKEHGENI
jgi:membrane protein required for colicin V production